MTALMLTRNRRQWVPKAIRAFQAQTYRKRELLIIADGEGVSDLIPESDEVRLIHLDRALTIGEKRNFGCDRATGEVICHWDDDDYSAPGRVADQVGRLVASGKAVTGYRSMRFVTDAGEWWLYRGDEHFSLGTALMYRREWWMEHPFPRLQVGEDNDMVYTAASAGQLAVVDAGEMMHATIHSGNTSPRNLENKKWTRI